MKTLTTVEISPLTARELKKGHPWITSDLFTKRFPMDESLLMITYGQRPIGIMLHDYSHPMIKGRIWSLFPATTQVTPFYNYDKFWSDLERRIHAAFEKRKSFLQNEENSLHKRENYYLLFGEGDDLPGLFLIKLRELFVVQLYSNTWEQLGLKKLITYIGKVLFEVFANLSEVVILIQFRSPDKNHAKDQDPERRPLQVLIRKNEDDKSRDKDIKKMFNIKVSEWNEKEQEADGNLFLNQLDLKVKEWGIEYHLHPEAYDLGLYTDMAEVRRILHSFWTAEHTGSKAATFLNLFSYTGAFDLTALACGRRVTSVELSKKHCQWIRDNLELNPQLLERSHGHGHGHEIHNECVTQLWQQKKERTAVNATYDSILCDPPPTFSLNQKKISSFQFYEMHLKNLWNLLAAGGEAYLFLNTHQISFEKFRGKIVFLMSKISADQTRYEIKKFPTHSWDRPQHLAFPEGDYLKGIILKKSGA